MNKTKLRHHLEEIKKHADEALKLLEEKDSGGPTAQSDPNPPGGAPTGP